MLLQIPFSVRSSTRQNMRGFFPFFFSMAHMNILPVIIWELPGYLWRLWRHTHQRPGQNQDTPCDWKSLPPQTFRGPGLRKWMHPHHLKTQNQPNKQSKNSAGYLWWSLCTLHLLACQARRMHPWWSLCALCLLAYPVRVTVDSSGLCHLCDVLWVFINSHCLHVTDWS